MISRCFAKHDFVHGLHFISRNFNFYNIFLLIYICINLCYFNVEEENGGFKKRTERTRLILFLKKLSIKTCH